ncbi:hypothetical protein MSG28_013644 [Choristoneura fumiferana]|uniref:Uncharacterized protein n=1 Tax=Choristoneura fumiferana TaxID=7141 RepID=A0ACC0K884_CHOFU|nr:hypothetical protein MSG28_013644 [Choristoneura fumiferana]
MKKFPENMQKTVEQQPGWDKFHSTVAVVVWALVATLVSAQITFSRDWTGGKRAPAPLDAQLTRLCRQFVVSAVYTLASQMASADTDVHAHLRP